MDVSIEELQRRVEVNRLYGQWGHYHGQITYHGGGRRTRDELRAVLTQLTLLGEGDQIPKSAWDLCDETR